MSNVDIGPRKTMFILVIVIGCFGVLWPKVLYPMFIGNAYSSPKPNSYDKLSAGCCDVIWEHDVDAIKIMFNLCENILSEQKATDPTTRLAFENGKLTTTIIETCRKKVFDTCNVDIAAFLTENVRLGRNYRQILDELRSTNSSLCLKYNFGVAPGALWVPHRITVNYVPNIRQERPAHLRPEMLHPALRERGRAIPPPPSIHAAGGPQAARVVPGRPGPIPGMRPTIGGPGHAVPAKTTTSTMGVVMPIYTIGIVIFFTYTLMKIMFKKNDSTTNGMYPPVTPDPHFQRHVFNRELSQLERTQGSGRLSKDEGSAKLVVTALSDMLDEVEQRREALAKQREPQRKTSTTTTTDSEHQVSFTNDFPTNESDSIHMNGNAVHDKITPSSTEHTEVYNQVEEEIIDEKEASKVVENTTEATKTEAPEVVENIEETTTIKVLGMEVTESCEGGQKWSRPSTPIAPPLHLTPPSSPVPPPSILLSGKLPAESQILVSTSSTDEEVVDDEDKSIEEPAIMLSGKITLSVIPSKKDVVENGKNTDHENDHEEEEEEYEEEEEEEIEIIYEDDEKKNEELEEDVEESKYVTVSAATDAIAADSEEEVEEEEEEEEEELEDDDDDAKLKKS